MAGDDKFDAVVVGGGPAGATAARLLSSWGHSVCLLTRPSAQPPLAESLPPSAVHVLERVGVRHLMAGDGLVEATGNTVWWGDGGERVEAFPAGTVGLQVLRTTFDEILLNAAEGAGVTVRRGASVREVMPAEGGEPVRQVRYEANGTQHRVDASWVLDCSGRSGVVARRGMRVTDHLLRTTALAGVWERHSPWPLTDWTHTTVESFSGGWAWSIPVSNRRRFVTVMLDPKESSIGGAEGLPERYARTLASCVKHATLVRDAIPVGEPFGVDATPYHAVSPAMLGLLLVGDAASFIDPLASFGVKKAIAGAWLGAVVVHTDLLTPGHTEAALQLFSDWERQTTAALRRGVQEFAAMAQPDTRRNASGNDFWRARTHGTDLADEQGFDTRQLRADPEVLMALAYLKSRDRVSLKLNDACRRVTRPLVRGQLVTLEEHLWTPSLDPGVRYLRNVDLIHLAGLSQRFNQVPDILDEYNRTSPPLPLPDLLGALSFLIARKVLEHA